MLKKFIITSDSSCDLSLEEVKKLDVKCVNLTYTIDEDVFYDDMIEEHLNEFYEKMKAGAAPKTSQVPPADFIKFFTPIIEKGMPVLHLSVGSALSGTYQSAVTALEMLHDENPNADIRLLNSTVASMGLGMLIYEAVKYRDSGRSIEETMARLDALKEHINMCITTDDLTYLCRGGRVSKAGAVFGSILSINPIITLSRGSKLYVSHKIRGKKGTFEKMSSLVGDTVLKPEKQVLYIMHADAIERAHELGNLLNNKFGFKEIRYLKFGTVIGSHAGPGLVAAMYFGKKRAHRVSPI